MKLKNNMLHVHSDTLDASLNAHKMGVLGEEWSWTIPLNGYIDIGYRKALHNIYLEINTPNTNNTKLVFEIHDGTNWIEVDAIDETRGFKKSGFIMFSEDIEKVKDIELHGKTLKWIRIKATVAATSAVEFNGINNVFCSNDDVNMVFAKAKFLSMRENQSHIVSIIFARNYILGVINNSGKAKYIYNDDLGVKISVNVEAFNQFDLFDNEELKEPSIYLVAWHQAMEQSDDDGDKMEKLADKMWNLYEKKLELFYARRVILDVNNDGIKNDTDIEESDVGFFAIK